MPAVATRDSAVDISSPAMEEKTMTLLSMTSPPPLNAPSHVKAKLQSLPLNKNPPSREKVTAAIALVRARQGTFKGPPDEVIKIQTGPVLVTGALSSTVEDSKSEHPTQTISNSCTEALNHGLSPARSLLTPKAQAQSPKQSEVSYLIDVDNSIKTPKAHVISSQGNSSIRQSPPGSFLANVFASRATASPLLSSMTSLQTIEVPPVDQENNTPRIKNHGSTNGFIGHGDVSRGRSRIAAAQMATTPASRIRARNQDQLFWKSVPVRMNSLHSMDSDEGSVDPKTLADVSRFIDALHKQNGGASPVKSLNNDVQVLPLEDSEDSEDSDDSLCISPEKIAEIGNFIDSVNKPKGEPSNIFVLPSSISQVDSDSSDDTVTINSETIAEIGNFIDAIAKPKNEPFIDEIGIPSSITPASSASSDDTFHIDPERIA